MVKETASSNRTRTGTVIWFGASYGFIKPDEGGPDIFARVRVTEAARRSVAFLAGERLRYELVTSGSPGRTEAIISGKA
jgi:cold shock CspA family protein